jgi:hypothetical protein
MPPLFWSPKKSGRMSCPQDGETATVGHDEMTFLCSLSPSTKKFPSADCFANTVHAMS